MVDLSRSDRLRELERAAALARSRRSRMRKAGLLPALPFCPTCGRKVLQETTLPMSSTQTKKQVRGPGQKASITATDT